MYRTSKDSIDPKQFQQDSCCTSSFSSNKSNRMCLTSVFTAAIDGQRRKPHRQRDQGATTHAHHKAKSVQTRRRRAADADGTELMRNRCTSLWWSNRAINEGGFSNWVCRVYDSVEWKKHNLPAQSS